MFDKLKIYRGSDIYLTPKIVIKQPTIAEICDFSEKKYFSAVNTLTSVGADLKWQLWDRGIDYTTINDYDLFIQLIYKMVGSQKNELRLLEEIAKVDEEKRKQLESFSQEELDSFKTNPLKLITNIDFDDFKPYVINETDEIILYNQNDDITIDRAIYHQMVDLIRQIHGFQRNNEIPGNETTKMDLIEDARDEALASQYKPYNSILRPLISYMKILNNQCGSSQIWNMKVNEFFYDLKKSGNMKETELLLKGAYSGFASLKGVDSEKLNMFGDLKNF